MKKIIISAVTVLAFCTIQAQSKRISTMLQQIAANAAHIEQIEKGIGIVKAGLNFVGDAKNGEFHLHAFFFNSLVEINPKVKEWAGVAEMIQLQVSILQSAHVHYALLVQSGQFSATELHYLLTVFSRCTDNTIVLLKDLQNIITPGQFQLSDDARIKRIEQLYQEMQDNNYFEKKLGTECWMLAMQRKNERKEVGQSKLINGLP